MWLLLWTLVRGISLESGLEEPTATTADKPVAERAWKRPWMVTLLEAYCGRLAIEATMEPPVTVSRNQGAEISDEREKGASSSTADSGGENPSRSRDVRAFLGFLPIM
jgi:hypothetical protein